MTRALSYIDHFAIDAAVRDIVASERRIAKELVIAQYVREYEMPSASTQDATKFVGAEDAAKAAGISRRKLRRSDDADLQPETDGNGKTKYPLRWRLTNLRSYRRRHTVRVAFATVVLAIIMTAGWCCIFMDGPGHSTLDHFR